MKCLWVPVSDIPHAQGALHARRRTLSRQVQSSQTKIVSYCCVYNPGPRILEPSTSPMLSSPPVVCYNLAGMGAFFLYYSGEDSSELYSPGSQVDAKAAKAAAGIREGPASSEQATIWQSLRIQANMEPHDYSLVQRLFIGFHVSPWRVANLCAACKSGRSPYPLLCEGPRWMPWSSLNPSHHSHHLHDETCPLAALKTYRAKGPGIGLRWLP